MGTPVVADARGPCYGEWRVSDDREYACPHCAAPLDVGAAPGGERFTCPACGEAFAVDGGDEGGGDTRGDELDGMRIRQLAAARRAAYRARSYCVIGSVACAVSAIQLVWMTVRHARLIGWGPRPIGYLLFAFLAVLASVYFARRGFAFHHEARRSLLADTADTPDFSSLDDGSKRWKNLENVR
jgi:hypothetical protein